MHISHLVTKRQLISTQCLHKGETFLVLSFFSTFPIPIPDSRCPLTINRFAALFAPPQKNRQEVGGALFIRVFRVSINPVDFFDFHIYLFLCCSN